MTVTVNPVNDAPVAADDSYTTDEDTRFVVPVPGVLANDTDADGPALSAVLVSGPANGTLNLNADGSFDYAPAADFTGADGFTYRASDGASNSNTATVTITVAARTWTRTGNLNTARTLHTATLLASGKVLVAGGRSQNTVNSFNSAELYDPAAGTWSMTARLNDARGEHTATLLYNRTVLAVGGRGTPTISSAELYGPLDGPPVGATFTITQLNTLFGFGWTNAGGGFALTGNVLEHVTTTSGSGPLRLEGGIWR